MLLTEASPQPSWLPSPWSILARDGVSHQKCGKWCGLSAVLSASPQRVSFLPDARAPAAQWELNSAWRLRVDSGLQAEAVCLLISSSTSVFTQLDSFTSHPNYLNICRAKLKLLYQSCIFRVPIFGLFPTHVFMISAKSSQPGDAPCGEGQQGRAEGRAGDLAGSLLPVFSTWCFTILKQSAIFLSVLLKQYVFPWNVLQQVTFWVKVGLGDGWKRITSEMSCLEGSNTSPKYSFNNSHEMRLITYLTLSSAAEFYS